MWCREEKGCLPWRTLRFCVLLFHVNPLKNHYVCDCVFYCLTWAAQFSIIVQNLFPFSFGPLLHSYSCGHTSPELQKVRVRNLHISHACNILFGDYKITIRWQFLSEVWLVRKPVGSSTGGYSLNLPPVHKSYLQFSITVRLQLWFSKQTSATRSQNIRRESSPEGRGVHCSMMKLIWKQLYMTTYRRRYYRPPTEFREGNVFSCVCLSFCLSTMGPNVTITYDALYLTVQAPGHETWDPWPCPLILTSGGQHCWPFQACWLEDPTPRATSGGGHWSTYALQPNGTHPIGMLSCSW